MKIGVGVEVMRDKITTKKVAQQPFHFVRRLEALFRVKEN
jgi:hypothetical protein